MDKKTIIWLEDNPNLSDYMPKLVDKQQVSLETCKTLKGFGDKCDFFLDDYNIDKLAGFIIDGVISSAHNLDDLHISNVNTKGGTDAGMLVVRDYLLRKPKFSNLPILVLSIVEDPERVYQSVAKVDRFSDGNAPHNVSFITKGMYHEGAQFIQSIKDWLNKLPK